jgi:putative flippase GtrA
VQSWQNQPPAIHEVTSAQFIQKIHHHRIVRFLGIGVVNTLFGYGVYAGLIFFSFSPPLALLMATVAGVIFNYFSFGRVVFQVRGHWQVFAKFVIAYAIVYTINAIILSLLTRGHYFNAYLAQAACALPSVAMSWILMNWWVYKGSPSHE